MILNNLISIPKSDLDEDLQEQIHEAFDTFKTELTEGNITGVFLVIKGRRHDEHQSMFACKTNYIPSMVGWVEKTKEALMQFIEV